MARSGFARVNGSGNPVRVECTHAQIIENILADLQRISSKCTVKREEQDISGETFIWAIKVRDVHWYDVFRWLVKRLCEQGWEPFEYGARVRYTEIVALRLVDAAPGGGTIDGYKAVDMTS